MAIPSPLVLQASANAWAGNDGNWSTWAIEVGTPSQHFNIIPSTSHGEVWVPVPEGCSWLPSSVNCAQSRGVGRIEDMQSEGFQTNASSSWEQIGIYELFAGGDLLNSLETGLYGLDMVSVANSKSLVSKQMVAGIATQDFWLGSLGLSRQSSDFSVANESIASFLEVMKTQNYTPSASYGLAIGASYNSSPGSLILGGYDKSKISEPGIEVSVTQNRTRSLTVGVQSMVATNTLNGTVSLTHELPGLEMAIDSGVSQLWLPSKICDDLAELLNLAYDPSTELYLISQTARSRLLDLLPEFTFTLAANVSSNKTVSIVVPYAALDMQVGIPVYNENTHYFPIRRAVNESLYVLGRALLQEVYLVVDWERSRFTISQAAHQTGLDPQIVPIPPLSDEVFESDEMGAGRVAGICVGVTVVVIVIFSTSYFLWRRKRRPQEAEENVAGDEGKRPGSPYPPDKKMDETAELSAADALIAEANSKQVYEMPQDQLSHQLMSTPIHELPAEMVERELEASPKAHEDCEEVEEGPRGARVDQGSALPHQ